MRRLSQFIDRHQAEGTIIEGQGTFTVDFSRALSKLAKFQLRNPNDSLIRLAQAANLGAESFHLAIVQKDPWTLQKVNRYVHTVTLKGWNPEYTLERIANSVLDPDFSGSEEALDYLRIGLTALFHLSYDGIDLIYRVAGEKGAHHLRFSSNFKTDFEESETANEETVLEIIWTATSKSEEKSDAEDKTPPSLKKSAILSRIPIYYGDHKLDSEAYIDFSIKDQNRYSFPWTKDLHWHYFGTADKKLPTVIEEHSEAALYSLGKTIVPTGSRTGLLVMNTDQNPQMDIFLVKAGMVVTKIQKESKVKGVTAYINVDDLKTDLTGSQFLESEELDKIPSWIEESSQVLIAPAIHTVEKIKQEQKETKPSESMGCLWALWTGFYLFLLVLLPLDATLGEGFLGLNPVLLWGYVILTSLLMIVHNRFVTLSTRKACQGCDVLISELKAHQEAYNTDTVGKLSRQNR